MKFPRILLISGGVIISLLLLVLLAGPVIAFFLKKNLDEHNAIKVDKIHLNILTGCADIIEIKLDSFSLSDITISGIIKSVDISGVQLLTYIFHKDISIGDITISDAIISIGIGEKSEETPAEKTRQSFISIEELKILNSQFRITTPPGDSIQINSEFINLEQVTYSGNTAFIDTLSFKFRESFFQTADRQYRIGWTTASCLTDFGGVVKIDSLSVIPLLETNEFFSKEKYQTDRFDLIIPETILRTRLSSLSSEKYSLNGSIAVNSGHLFVIRDKNIERKPDDFKPTIQELLHNSPIPISLDSIEINSCMVRYAEIADDENTPGAVDFDSLDAVISNIRTGNPVEGSLTIDAFSRFMNKGRLNAYFEFPYTSNYFDCRGSLETMQFMELNQASEPLAKVTFSQGEINKLFFNFRAEPDSSRGDLLFYYSNLHFAIARNASGDTTGLKSEILTFIADEILVADANPTKNGTMIKGFIREKRNRERFIFNYMWKSIFSGIKSTILGNTVKTNKKGRKE